MSSKLHRAEQRTYDLTMESFHTYYALAAVARPIYSEFGLRFAKW